MLGLVVLLGAPIFVGGFLPAGVPLGTSRGQRRHAGFSPAMGLGDVATVDYKLTLEDGSPLPTAFDQGRVRLLVGGGGYMPALHKALENMGPGDEEKKPLPPSETFGEFDPGLVAEVDISQGPKDLAVGRKLRLWTGQTARVTAVGDKTFTIDANPENAGNSAELSVKVLDVAGADTLETATFAGGCFWGLELAFQREPGVISTKVGYTQGQAENPTYSDVCAGTTGHTEAVQVAYDPTEVEFKRLLEVFFDKHDPTQLNRQGNDRGTQYRGGVYFHTPEQEAAVKEYISSVEQKKHQDPVVTEVLPAAVFYDGEEYHQQYLQKGGQLAKKQATEPIRCYG